MTIRFVCPECSSVLKIKDELAGTNGKCPKCKTKFTVPAAESAPAEAAVPSIEAAPAVETGPTVEAVPAADAALAVETAPTGEAVPAVAAVPSDESEAIPAAAESENKTSGEDGGYELRSADDTAVPAPPATDDDLDSPPLIVMPSDDERESPPMLVMESSAESDRPSKSSGKQATKRSLPASAASDSFDPLAFLNAEPPKAGRAPYPSSPVKVPDDESDAERRDGHSASGRGRKSSRTDGASTSAAPKTSSEAGPIDSVNLAKQMMQAMKDSNSQAATQRDDEKHPGFDFAGMFREIGLKGGGGLALVLVVALGLYWVSNSMMGGGLKLPKLGYVTGTVLLDGIPVEGANVYFSPEDVKIPGGKQERARTSIGVTDSNGNYRMQYMGGVEGVAVGKCRIWIKQSMPSPGRSIPAEFGEGAMLMKDVAAGSQVIPFEMKSKQ